MQGNRKNSFLIVLFIGLLLAISPCSVRKALQHAFGEKVTDTLNKSNTTIQQCNLCNVEYNPVQNTKVENDKENTTNFSSAILIPNLPNYDVSLPFTFNTLNEKRGRKNSVPLYILYKRLKYMI